MMRWQQEIKFSLENRGYFWKQKKKGECKKNIATQFNPRSDMASTDDVPACRSMAMGCQKADRWPAKCLVRESDADGALCTNGFIGREYRNLYLMEVTVEQFTGIGKADDG